MFNSDDKIVSISFDNKKFLDEVQNTINALERLNDATSGKNLRSDGLNNLSGAFTNLSRSATSNIDSINRAVSDTSSYSKLSNSVEESGRSFSALEIVAVGALMNIGGAAVTLGSKIASSLTRGIRDGWGEYNLLMDSTQTILANTQRYGTTMGDVTAALDELNTYADKTIYNFSQMTRNIGYFTTAGQNLEDSVMAIRGMSNLGAFFGANNENVARATYQMSQAMSAGIIKLMDWKSLENASMAGAALQDELINTAAVMSGMSVDAFKEYIGYSKGFRNTLEANWLTADVFRETLRKFAGESREYWESLTANNGERLYSDEEIDRIMRLGETAEEAATKVRTFRMMIDALSESIGSGWAETFRILIGDLEQAKEFWTPINDLLAGENGIISSIGQWRNTVLRAWADVYRDISVNDLMVGLNAIGDIFKAIGNGITSAFGTTDEIANKIGTITEALGDFAYTLRLDEDELQDVSDLVEGLISPFMIFADIINELAVSLFNSTVRLGDFTNSGNSLADKLKPIRKVILNIVGAFGRYLIAITNFIRSTGIIQKAFSVLFNTLKIAAGLIGRTFNVIFSALNSLWNRYDMTNKILNFVNIVYSSLMSLKPIFGEVVQITKTWFDELKNSILAIDFTPIEDFTNILDGVITLFNDLLDPTVSLTEAFDKFKSVLANTSIGRVILVIKNSIVELISAIHNSSAGPLIDGVISGLNKMFNIAKYAIGGIILLVLKIKDILSGSNIAGYISNIGDAIVVIYNKIKATNIGSYILGMVDNIRSGIDNLVKTFKGNKATNTASVFVNSIKDALTVDGKFSDNNVFTFVKGMSDSIKDTVGDISDGRKFGQVRDTIRMIKSTSDDIINTVSSWKEYPDINENNNIEWWESIVQYLFRAIETYRQIGSSIIEYIKGKLQTFSDALSLLASGERYRDLDNAQRFADIVGLFVRVFTRISSMVILFLSILTPLKWAQAVESLGAGFAALGKGIKKAFAAKKWAQIASIFKTITVLAIAIMAGIFLISKFADINKFNDVLMNVSMAIGGLIFGITVLVGIIMVMGASIAKNSKKLGINSAKTIAGIAGIFKSVTKILTRVVFFITVISLIALSVAKLGDTGYKQFQGALWSIIGAFLAITTILMVTTGIIVGLSKTIGPLEAATTAISVGNNAITSPLQQMLYVFTTIATTITATMAGLMASLALVMFVSKDTGELETGMKWFGLIMTVMLASVMGIIALITLASQQIDPTKIMAMNGVTGQILTSMTYVMLSISLIVATITLAFKSIVMDIAILSTTLSLMSDDNKKYLVGILIGLGVFLIGIISAFTIITAIVSGPQINPLRDFGSDMLKTAGAIAIFSVGIAIIIGALTSLLVLTQGIKWTRFVLVTLIVVTIFSAVAAILGAGTILMNTMPNFKTSKLLTIAGSFMLLSASLIPIAASLLLVAALPINKIAAAGIAIGAIFTVMALALGLIAGLVPNQASIAIVGTVLVAMSLGILAIGTAMLKASIGFDIFSNALKKFQNLDGGKIRDNILSIAEALPDMLRMVITNFDLIKTTIVGMGGIIGTALATMIFNAFTVFNALMVTSGGSLIAGIGSIIVGIIYGVLLVIKEFLETIVKPGSILWDILDILGQFLVKAAEYIGYYGFSIIESFFKGIISAITDVGWDLYVTEAFNNIFTGIKNWWEANVSHWLESKIAEVVHAWDIYGPNSEYQSRAEDLAEHQQALQEFETVHRAAMDQIYGEVTQEALAQLVGESESQRYFGILHDIEQDRAYMQAAQDEIAYADTIYDAVMYDIQSDINARTAANDQLHDLIDEDIERTREMRVLANNAPDYNMPSLPDLTGGSTTNRRYSTYMPDQYRGLAMDLQKVDEASEDASNGIFNFGQRLRDALGLSEDQSFGDALLGFLGIGNAEGFTQAGESDGSSWATGFGSALENASIPSTDSVLNMDTSNADYGEFSSALNNAVSLPEEAKNPVISPVLDDTKFWSDFGQFENTWNEKTYDQFAIDADSSMLLREQSQGDASTNGEVTYSFTQINNSPRELSPIQLYRDGRNLLRGSGTFRAT